MESTNRIQIAFFSSNVPFFLFEKSIEYLGKKVKVLFQKY